MKKFNKKQMEIIEENFRVHEDENGMELETWTDGGVNMFIELYNNIGEDRSYIIQFKDYIENFDMDEEIDILRQDERYRKNFKISQSVQDFKDYIEWLYDILNKLIGEN